MGSFGKIRSLADLPSEGDFAKMARATYEAFTYSHRKDYAAWIAEAKRAERRTSRVKQAIEWMAEGKPRHWKYVK